jgi:hypothetical protein
MGLQGTRILTIPSIHVHLSLVGHNEVHVDLSYFWRAAGHGQRIGDMYSVRGGRNDHDPIGWRRHD